MLVSFLLSALLAASVALPGGPPVGMDYLAYDATTGRIWVPAGNTGNVDVVEVATGKVTTVGGFPTAPPRRPGRPRMGPSSAAVGDGVVWIGNRATDEICAIDARTLARTRGPCHHLPSMPDGLAYLAATHEVWVTTPGNQAITIVDVSGTKPPAVLKIGGDPEGVAVDSARGVFYTNVEDQDRTLEIDARTRKVVASWQAGCGAAGPRGLTLDEGRRLLFVACTDGAVARDVAHEGKEVGRLKTSGGVDNIDYAAQRGLLFVASGQDATLTVARVSGTGALGAVASIATAKGARSVVVAADGTAYVPDSAGGRLIVVKPPP
jgi:DNA-binding beta-propeller fold protein YncE